jgi:hypothetical protein
MNKGAVTPPPFNFPMKKKKYMEKVKKKFRLRRNKGAVSWVSTDTVNPPPLPFYLRKNVPLGACQGSMRKVCKVLGARLLYLVKIICESRYNITKTFPCRAFNKNKYIYILEAIAKVHGLQNFASVD